MNYIWIVRLNGYYDLLYTPFQNITWIPTKVHTIKTPSIKPKTIFGFQSKHFQDLYSPKQSKFISPKDPPHFFGKWSSTSSCYFQKGNTPIFKPSVSTTYRSIPTLPRQARVLRLATETTRTDQAFGLLLSVHRLTHPDQHSHHHPLKRKSKLQQEKVASETLREDYQMIIKAQMLRKNMEEKGTGHNLPLQWSCSMLIPKLSK